jgi:exodeoxyribonuclease VII small subunit
MNNNMSFEQAFNELERIANELKAGKVTIDQLIPAVKQANAAKKICEKRIIEIKAELEKLTANDNEQ